MEQNRNWAGIAALLLAGLALLVALDGRAGNMFGGAAPAGVAVPLELRAREEALRMWRGEIPAIPRLEPAHPAIPGQVVPPTAVPPEGWPRPEEVVPAVPHLYVHPPVIVEDRYLFGTPGPGLFRELFRLLMSYVPQLLQVVGAAALVILGIRLLNRRGSTRET